MLDKKLSRLLDSCILSLLLVKIETWYFMPEKTRSYLHKLDNDVYLKNKSQYNFLAYCIADCKLARSVKNAQS